MGLRIERDPETAAISGVSVIPEMPEALSAEEAMLTVILDPSLENMRSGARHSDSRVRWAVALHPRLEGRVAADLVGDASGDVRRALALNPATPTAVLEQLGEQEDPAVANAALRALVERLKEELDQR